MSNSEKQTTELIMSRPKRQRRSLDEDDKTLKFAEEKKNQIFQQVSDLVESYGSDMNLIQENLTNSDNTLKKVQQFFDSVCGTDIKTDAYYLDLLTIHAQLSPPLIYLAKLAVNDENEAGIWANAIKEMYAEGSFMRTQLFQQMYDKKNYHQEYVRQLADALKKLGVTPKISYSKVRDPRNPLSNAASFL